MLRNSDFCAFILTHGRPDNVVTYETLRKAGYTGRIFIVIDDEDSTAERYRARYGDEVLMFSKADIAQRFDEGDNFNNRKAIIYARNACFELAKQLGFTYFIELDDDYIRFEFRIDAQGQYIDDHNRVRDLDAVFDLLLEYYKSIPALSLAMAQSGDFVGGKRLNFSSRKCMNSFICSTERPFTFFGRLNEDVNVYTNLGRRGGLFLTVKSLAIMQHRTQAHAGGMTETYLDGGTYIKSFYSVMYSPSCVKINQIPSSHPRIHHQVKWTHTAPMILDERHRKPRDEARH